MRNARRPAAAVGYWLPPVRLNPWRQACEGALAAERGLQFGEFLVAQVVAALFNEVGSDGKLLCRFVMQAVTLRLASRLRLHWAIVGEPIERRERLAARKGEPSAFERQVTEIETHPPQLGDLLDFVKMAHGAIPTADAAMKDGA